MTDRAYEVRVVDAMGMSMSGDFSDCYVGEVYHVASGEVAWRSRLYREKNTARLQAARLRPRYDHHLAKHGFRFEVEQRVKKDDLRRRREAASKARKEVMNNAHKLLLALRAITDATPGSEAFDTAMAQAKALIEPLDWQEVPTA